MWNLKFVIWNGKFEFWNLNFEIWNWKFEIWENMTIIVTTLHLTDWGQSVTDNSKLTELNWVGLTLWHCIVMSVCHNGYIWRYEIMSLCQ